MDKHVPGPDPFLLAVSLNRMLLLLLLSSWLFCCGWLSTGWLVASVRWHLSGAPKEFWFLVGRCNKDCWLAGQLASATIITRKCNKQRFSNVINIRTTFRCFYFIAVDSLYHWAFRSCDWEVAGVRSEHCDCSGQLVLFLAQCELAAIVLIAVHGVLADL